MQKAKLDDPLLASADPDRVNYQLGVMLDARDFVDEQTYHRGRLARVLAAVHGHGTVAGLGVELVVARPPHGPELRVNAGLAIDRFGRLIELPRAVCIDLERWWGPARLHDDTDEATRLRVEALRRAFKPAHDGLPDRLPDRLIADVFIRFLPCGRGLTPAFASGPADALDATVPARVRDAAEVRLVPRSEDKPLPPADPWAGLTGADLAARLAALHGRQLDRWSEIASPPPPVEVPQELAEPAPGLPDDGRHERRAQWLLLARVTFPATAPAGPDTGPRPAANPPPDVNNLIRSFVLVPATLPALFP